MGTNKGQRTSQSFFKYSTRILSKLAALNRLGTLKNYNSSLRSFKRFLNCDDIELQQINQTLIEKYEVYLHALGIVPNSISFYMRNLRAIYNRSVEEGLCYDTMPFKYVYTGIDRTHKRALGLDEIRQIKNLDLSSNPKVDLSRDIFMFLFYCRGMSFIDAAYLKTNDIRNDSIRYYRHKTGQFLQVRLVEDLKRIIDKYTSACSGSYILPILSDGHHNKRKQYQNALHLTNQNLKKIGVILDLRLSLTTYVSRHSWASIANSKNIPINIISAALGHESILTTQIYLDSIDIEKIDQANEMIINCL